MPGPGRYYWTLFLDAHKVSREKREAVLFIAAEVGSLAAALIPNQVAAASQQAQAWLQAHRWWSVGLMVTVMVVAMARENWRRIKVRDNEISWLRRKASRRYELLCAAFESCAALATSPIDLSGVPSWVEAIKANHVRILEELKPHLTAGEYQDLNSLRFEIPVTWKYALSDEHKDNWFHLDALQAQVRKLRDKYERELAMPSTTGSGASTRD
jgi:hypothetical protein